MNNGWTNSTFDASSYTDNQIAGREGSRSGAGARVDGTVSNGFFGIGASGYNVVGINVGKIPGIRQVIKEYVDAIQNHLSAIEPLASADNAFKSEDVQTAVKNYIEKVKTYCINLTSQLLAFSDKLADVRDAYEASMSTLSGNVDAQNSAFSEGTKYQEQRQ